MLQEYHFILNKLLDRVQKKTKEHEAIAVLQRSANAQYALSPGQQGGPPPATQPPSHSGGQPPAPRPHGVLSPQVRRREMWVILSSDFISSNMACKAGVAAQC